MIFEVIERSLRQPNRVIPVEALLGNCDGSRMPEVIAAQLTHAVASRLVEGCPTAAFRIEENNNRPSLGLFYGEGTWYGKCFCTIPRGRGRCSSVSLFWPTSER